LESLMRDYAKNGQVSLKTIDEALAGVVAESQGILQGPLVRDSTGAGEFIDLLGQVWDVKMGISRAPNGRPIFQLDHFVGKIKRELLIGENIILDLRCLEVADLQKLIQKLKVDFTMDQCKRIVVVT